MPHVSQNEALSHRLSQHVRAGPDEVEGPRRLRALRPGPRRYDEILPVQGDAARPRMVDL